MSQQPMEKSSNYSHGQLATQVNHSVDKMMLSQQPHQRPKRNSNFVIGIVIGVVATIIGTKFIGNNPANQSVSQETLANISSATSNTVSQSITTTTAKIINVESKIEATGIILPYELIPVMSQVNNLQIKSILVDEGDFVNQGQVLIRLDDAVLQAERRQAQAVVQQAQARLAELKAGARREELARAKESINIVRSEILEAQADLRLAQVKLERNRQLQVEGAISRDRLDELVNEALVKKTSLERSKAKLREAQQQLLELQKGPRREVIAQAQASLAEALARVKLIETRLKETIIIAPVNGKVAKRNARVGDVTSAGNNQELFTIIQDGKLELEVRVPESELRNIRPQQRVEISSTADQSINLIGIVRDINPIIDRESRQGIVNVDLPVDNGLKPGMFIQANIITTTEPRLTIPMAAVIPQNNGKGTVYVLQENNMVKSQPVSLGEIVDNNAIEILSGIRSGDTIALKGVDYLQDGNTVDVVQ